MRRCTLGEGWLRTHTHTYTHVSHSLGYTVLFSRAPPQSGPLIKARGSSVEHGGGGPDRAGWAGWTRPRAKGGCCRGALGFGKGQMGRCLGIPIRLPWRYSLTVFTALNGPPKPPQTHTLTLTLTLTHTHTHTHPHPHTHPPTHTQTHSPTHSEPFTIISYWRSVVERTRGY